MHASVVNELLNQQHGDLLFAARLKEGSPASLWLHFEHQSTVDYRMSMRMVKHTVECADLADRSV